MQLLEREEQGLPTYIEVEESNKAFAKFLRVHYYRQKCKMSRAAYETHQVVTFGRYNGGRYTKKIFCSGETVTE